MRGRLFRIWPGLLAVLLLAPACSRDDPKPAPKSSPAVTRPSVKPSASNDPVLEATRSQAIDPLFEAIRKDDTEALKELVHPEAEEVVENAVTKLASGYRAMKVKELKIATGTSTDTSGHNRTVEVGGSYAIPGIEGRFEFGGTFEFLESFSHWKLIEFDWGGVPVWRVPGPLTRTENDGAVVFHPPDFPGDELAGFAAAGLDRLEKLGAARGAPYLIVVAGEEYGLVADSRSEAAAMSRIEWDGERFKSATPYVAVKSSSYLKADPAQRKAIVVHELTHAALMQDASFYTPAWLSEGLAVYYSGDLDLDALKSRAGDTGRLDGMKISDLNSEFTIGFDPDLSDTYAYAGAVVSMLTERFGEKTVLEMHNYFKTALTADEVNDLYDSPFLYNMVRTAIDRDTAQDLTEKFFAERLQMPVQDVDTATKQWVREHW